MGSAGARTLTPLAMKMPPVIAKQPAARNAAVLRPESCAEATLLKSRGGKSTQKTSFSTPFQSSLDEKRRVRFKRKPSAIKRNGSMMAIRTVSTAVSRGTDAPGGRGIRP